MAERFGILCADADWTGPPRTAGALTRRGAEVCVIAPADSYAAKTCFKHADILMPFEGLNRHLPAIARTLAEEYGAHSILAGDDAAFTALAILVQRMDRLDLSQATRALIARSMPDAKIGALLTSASDFIVAQRGNSCLPPRSLGNPSLDEAYAFARAIGYPVMVKRDGFAAGAGVTLCNDEGQLRAAMDARVDNPRNKRFVVQKYVSGVTYGATVSGVKGRSMSAISFIKHCTTDLHGPTSVARYAPRHDILTHASELFETLGLNGYAGFDYVVDGRDVAHFIEINPRLMPTSHLDCLGVDLTAAFLAGVRGQPAPAPKPVLNEYVALFPGEWMRDFTSEYLRCGIHDVPWDDPPVFAAMIDETLKYRQRSLQAGFFAY